MARLEELKSELAATVTYGQQLGEELQNPDLTAAERVDREADLEAIEKKAEGLQLELKREQRNVEREQKIKAIGRDMEVRAEDIADDIVVPSYADPVEAFFKSEDFARFREDVRMGRRDAKTDAIEYKAAADITSEQAGDKDTSAFAPGIANLNYRFPTEVGGLFTQGTMTGSNISFLKMPAGATGDAEYQTIGQQKGGTFVGTLDVVNETAKTIAAVATIPSQNLDDVAGLESEVRAILLQGPDGVGEQLEDAYINGAGGSSEIQGILDLSPSDSTLVGDYASKSVFKAMADINAATGFTADAVVCHPDDWFILSTEVGSVDDRPLFGPWGSGWGQNGIGPRLVVSRKIASGTVLVGAFRAATRYVRQGVTISADASGLGLRDKNLVLFVAEVRELVLHRYGADPFRTVTVTS